MSLATIRTKFTSLFKRGGENINTGISARVKDYFSDWKQTIIEGSLVIRIAVATIVFFTLLVLVLGLYFSREPDVFLWQNNFDSTSVLTSPVVPEVTGSVTTASLIVVANTLLSKSGGYLSNDILPPGVFLDNIPNWEFGVLVQVRDLSKAFREVFSRSQSQSTEDRDLVIAEPRLNFDSESWILPSTESVYREAIEKLNAYHERLVDPTLAGAQFYARTDNLEFWLGSVEKRLGSLSQRLSASVGQRRLNTDLAGQAAATQSTPTAEEIEIKTPFSKIDDVFYEARGTTWALIHFLKAIENDFADVLDKKNAKVSLKQIIRELEATQVNVFSPIILNGSGFGIVPNHSLVMASYISRAHAAIIDLRELLTQG
jgi:hypothetical protein